MPGVHAELKLMLVEGVAGESVRLHVYGSTPACLGLSVWREGNLRSFSTRHWLLDCLYLNPIQKRWVPPRACALEIIRAAAVKLAVDGIEQNHFEKTLEGLATFYTWQVSNGAPPLPNAGEMCKVYTDTHFAIYVRAPTLACAKKYGLALVK